tara:strand:+ start:17690 stop:19210 length:1521 start_codon:yes stop_codon:yes gene_type:complete
MKTLIKISPPLWPIFEIELDLIMQELSNNRSVTMMICNGKKNYCIANPKMSKIKCSFCKSRFKKGLNIIKKKFNTKKIKFVEEKFDHYKTNYKFSNKSLENFKLKKIDFGSAVLGTIITQYKNKNIDIKKYNFIANALLDESMKTLENFKKIIKCNYSKILIFNGRHYNYRPILRYCQLKKINAYSYDYPYHTHNGYLIRKLDFTQNLEKRSIFLKKKTSKLDFNKIKNEGIKFLNNRINKKPTGSFPVFNIDQKEILPKNFDLNKINIAIFNVTDFESITINENKKLYLFNDQIQATEFIISKFRGKNVQFYLRYHPNAYHEKIDIEKYKLLEKKYSNFSLISPYSKISSHYLIKNSNFVISFGSTVGLEAVFLKKNLITLGPSSYMKFKIDTMPQSKNSLFKIIKKLIKTNKFKKNNYINAIKAGYALKYEHQKLKYLVNKAFYYSVYNINNQKIIIDNKLTLYIVYKLLNYFEAIINNLTELIKYPKRFSFIIKNYIRKIKLN